MARNKDSNRVAICYITDKRDNILMGKRRDSGLYTTPGGHILVGEDAFDGCCREMCEETGLDIQTAELVKMGKEGEKLLYMYKITVNPEQEIDTTQDPDKEVETWEYVDPVKVFSELHIPKEHNWIIKYWAGVL